MPQLSSFRAAALATLVAGLAAATPAFADSVPATSPPLPAPVIPAPTPTPADYPSDPVSLSIYDRVGLPGKDKPDSISAWGWYSSPKLSVMRGGQVIAVSEYPGGSWLELADLRVGDTIVLRSEGGAWYPGGYPDYPLYPYEVRYVYKGLPKFDAPLCAGAKIYEGSLVPGTFLSSWGQAILWKADPSKTGEGTLPYPWVSPPYPEAYYPGWYPGYAFVEAVDMTYVQQGKDRFIAVPAKPLAPDTLVPLGAWNEKQGQLSISVNTESKVKDCTPEPTPTPTVAPTPTSTPVPTPTPVPDTTAPKGGVTAPSPKAIKKLGAKKLLKGGVPLTLNVSEPARLKGTISLLGGKKPVRADVSIAVKAGKSTVTVAVPNSLRKAVKKVSKKKSAKLQLKLALVDAAGNRLPLKTITIKLPK